MWAEKRRRNRSRKKKKKIRNREETKERQWGRMKKGGNEEGRKRWRRTWGIGRYRKEW